MNIDYLNKALKNSFLRVKQEFINIRLWFDYFSTKFSQNDLEHSQMKAFLLEQQKFNHHTSEFLKELSLKVYKLENEFNSLNDENNSITKDNIEIKSSLSEIKQLHSSISELFKVIHASLTEGHVRDISRTRPGHLKDMRTFEENKYFHPTPSVSKEVLPKGSENTLKKQLLSDDLTTSEKYILRILLNASKPLSYAELSRMSARKEKTIRNIIYTLRKKGFNVKDKFSEPKEKVFFIPTSLKLVLSGR